MGLREKKGGTAPDLDEIRKRINDVDEQIQTLINERAKFAQQVGVAKGELGAAAKQGAADVTVKKTEILGFLVTRNFSKKDSGAGFLLDCQKIFWTKN